MIQKTLIIYDLKEKTNAERTAISKKLYGHRDKSNYTYTYTREGLLSNLDVVKSKKMVLQLKNIKDLPKITQMLKELQVPFDIAKV